MKLIERGECVITGKNDLELLSSFKEFPIYMGCVDASDEVDLYSDMDWYISKEAGFIQLKHLIPLDILYAKQHVQAVGTIWREHHKLFAKFISNFNRGSILEIGGAHGLLAGYYKSEYDDSVEWTMVEPNPKLLTDIEINIIKGLIL